MTINYCCCVLRIYLNKITHSTKPQACDYARARRIQGCDHKESTFPLCILGQDPDVLYNKITNCTSRSMFLRLSHNSTHTHIQTLHEHET